MKLQILLLALTCSVTSLFSQTTDKAVLKTALAQQQILDTPAEHERIKMVCLAETQAYYDCDYEAWAATHYKGETDHITWNNPDGTYGTMDGWDNIGPGMKGYFEATPKNDSKLSQSNFTFLIRGEMAYTCFDQYSVQADVKTGKSRECRTLLFDVADGKWKVVGVSAFLDYSGSK